MVSDSNGNLNTDINLSNAEIETILREQFSRAIELLETHQSAFMQDVQELQMDSLVTADQMAEFMGWATRGPGEKITKL